MSGDLSKPEMDAMDEAVDTVMGAHEEPEIIDVEQEHAELQVMEELLPGQFIDWIGDGSKEDPIRILDELPDDDEHHDDGTVQFDLEIEMEEDT